MTPREHVAVVDRAHTLMMRAAFGPDHRHLLNERREALFSALTEARRAGVPDVDLGIAISTTPKAARDLADWIDRRNAR